MHSRFTVKPIHYYSQSILKMAQIYWDEFFEASVTLANSQREKLIPVERYDLMYYFYFGLTILL